MSSGKVRPKAAKAGLPLRFQVWGARGSRNAVGSEIGNSTSCYSLQVGEDLFVFDAGSGMVALSASVFRDPEFRSIRRIHLLVTHAHIDHWEGLKDAEWFWTKGCGVDVTLLAPRETLDAIAATLQPPVFVELNILAIGTVDRLSYVELQGGETRQLPKASLEVVELYHYSGLADNKRFLDTYGFRLSVENGPTVLYMCDHEPVPETRAMEDAAMEGADLAIVDASYCHVSQHAFGHGSIESAADVAKRYPETLVLAGHHGAMQEDTVINDAMGTHGTKVANFGLAYEDMCLDWDAESRRFVRSN